MTVVLDRVHSRKEQRRTELSWVVDGIKSFLEMLEVLEMLRSGQLISGALVGSVEGPLIHEQKGGEMYLRDSRHHCGRCE